MRSSHVKLNTSYINIEEHKAFHDGLDAMSNYLISLKGKESEFDGKKLVDIIHSFGDVLRHHLANKINFLDNLRSFGAKLGPDLARIMVEEGGKAVGSMSMTTELAFFFFNHDVEFEGGIHEPFLEGVPAVVRWGIRHVGSLWHRS